MDRSVIKAEIARLVDVGARLYKREGIAWASPEQKKKLTAVLENDPDRKDLLTKPKFVEEYQGWYSPALRVVEQLLPDRYSEFRDLYSVERRKETILSNFGIADYISGVRPRSVSEDSAINRALSCFDRQIAILRTASSRLDSVLTDIGRTLQAEILDNELEAAKGLLSASHVRAAGVVGGVVLEGHLKKLIADHRVPFKKKALLSNLNEALKDANVYDAPQWRKIQYLTDIRNLCGHRNDRDPERDEVDTLITEVEKIVKTLF